MNFEEYIALQKRMARKHVEEAYNLRVSFIRSANPIKTGDFITDHMGTIKVEKSMPYGDDHKPTCCYEGPRYTKAGKPFKNGQVGVACYANIKKVNGKTFIPGNFGGNK